jgi:hypothetical protein
LILIGAIVAAIIFFVGCYAKTVRDYLVLLRKVAPAINGKLNSTFLWGSITLAGDYKGREIVCAIEQLKEGSDALIVKIKLHDILPLGAPADKKAVNKVRLSGGWLAPRFSISENKFDAESFKQHLDRLILICDTLERHPQSGEKQTYTPTVQYKTLEF